MRSMGLNLGMIGIFQIFSMAFLFPLIRSLMKDFCTAEDTRLRSPALASLASRALLTELVPSEVKFVQ